MLLEQEVIVNQYLRSLLLYITSAIKPDRCQLTLSLSPFSSRYFAGG